MSHRAGIARFELKGKKRMNFVDMNMDMGNPRCLAGGGQIVEIWKSNL